ncbi:uncharacterized protein LOC144204373 isoform X2 [Stigmatopora nigra]
MSAEQVSDIVCDPSSESPTSAGHKPANFTLSASMRALMEARSTAIVSVLSQRRMNKDMGQWTGLQKDSPSQVGHLQDVREDESPKLLLTLAKENNKTLKKEQRQQKVQDTWFQQVDMQMRISHEAEENRMIISEIRRLQQEITLQENEEEQEEK